MSTTWREQKFNAAYVLGCQPDFIVFSTGDKPSAPAEQALFLYPQFLESYGSVDWYGQSLTAGDEVMLLPAYKKFASVENEIVPAYPMQYVQQYKKGREFFSAGKFPEALEMYDSASVAFGPKPNKYLLYHRALCYFKLGQHDLTQSLLGEVLAMDPATYGAHKYLYLYASVAGDETSALEHISWIKENTPWAWETVQSEVNRVVSKLR
jgi:tetratricopeptide (TPR) repeat protein